MMQDTKIVVSEYEIYILFYIHIVSVLAVLGKESDSDNPSYKRISMYLGIYILFLGFF